MNNELRSGLLSITFRPLGVDAIVALAREAKLESIEWGGDVHVPHGDLDVARRVAQATADAGLGVSAYGSYYRAGTSEAQGLSFASVLDSAIALGTDTIRVWPGTKGSKEATPAERGAIADDLRRVAGLAAARGVRVALEFHGGTLTDDADSCVALLRQVGAPNLVTFWQPPNSMPTDDCCAGLRKVLPWLANLHVFHWWPTSAERHPLEVGEARWRAFLDIVRAEAPPAPRFASLEFVRGDDVSQARDDARTLHRWLGAR
jgi:sugar phosphate isomerase/epimerase